jgi:hypothetical protein
MRADAAALIAELEVAATAAQQAENALREKMAQEVARLERRRAFAYRRLNLMRTLAPAIASAESEEAAVAKGLAILRTELGWTYDSETRKETLTRFEPVVRATFAGLVPGEAETPVTAADIHKELSDFETWYETRFERPFWALFDQEIVELPLVER